MSIIDVVKIIGQILTEALGRKTKFTGTIVFTLPCKDGGITKITATEHLDIDRRNMSDFI